MDELPSTCLSFVFAEGDAAVSYSAGTIIIKLVIVLLLVAANGFFVAAEFAFVGVRSSRIETLANQGSRAAKRLMELLGNLSRIPGFALDRRTCDRSPAGRAALRPFGHFASRHCFRHRILDHNVAA